MVEPSHLETEWPRRSRMRCWPKWRTFLYTGRKALPADNLLNTKIKQPNSNFPNTATYTDKYSIELEDEVLNYMIRYSQRILISKWHCRTMELPQYWKKTIPLLLWYCSLKNPSPAKHTYLVLLNQLLHIRRYHMPFTQSLLEIIRIARACIGIVSVLDLALVS